MRIAFIGSAGIPNRYGGFEAFLEHCAPRIAELTTSVTVTCDINLYDGDKGDFRSVKRRFLRMPANGVWSIIHDLVAFLTVFRGSTHIVVLGVSGGPWFPLFRLLCSLTGKQLLVNVDGVEWRRSKFTPSRRLMLRVFDALAQLSAHRIIYDNPALYTYVLPSCRPKAFQIGYSGDHVIRRPDVLREAGTALTVCRIEPENNIEMLIDGAMRSRLTRYTIVGNWSKSDYGMRIRERHRGNARLALMDPIYDANALASLREACEFYVHGHSVGGTNPSLVEMLFYDGSLLCFDCAFNRETASDCAQYFSDAAGVARLLDAPQMPHRDRSGQRKKFTRDTIAALYVDAFGS